MSPMRKIATLVPCALVVALAGASAQQPVFRAGVEVIEIDVSVVDERGRPITDLLAPEFTVTVGGQPRRVLAADLVSLRPEPRGPRPPAEPDFGEAYYSTNAAGQDGRLIVIAVDRESISFGQGAHALRAAGRFLERLNPEDKVALVTVPVGPSADFTSNHGRIRRQLETIVTGGRRLGGHINLGVSEAFALDDLVDQRMAEGALQRHCGELPPESRAFEECVLLVRQEARIITSEIRQRSGNSIRALISLLRALADVDGPKSVVWISEGLVVERGGGDLAFLESLAAAARTTLNVIMLDAPLADPGERLPAPTPIEDRSLQVIGLELLADMSRGVLYRVSAGADAIFARMEEALSVYYLLAVESAPEDRDGRRRAINVSVGRRGAIVRARRQFQAAPETAATNETPEERLRRTLQAPFAATELPLRLATYAYQDAEADSVRVIAVTEIAAAGPEPTDVTLAYALLDADGDVTAGDVRRVTVSPTHGPTGHVYEHVAQLAVEPGAYTLKVAVIDEAGRRGSLEHPVVAWQMTGVPFAVGDLMLADLPADADLVLRPTVEAHLTTGLLAAYLELYAEQAEFFDGFLEVLVEVAADETGRALAAAIGEVSAAGDGRRRTVSAVVPVDTLPPGTYVARARVVRNDEMIGQLQRSFRIARAAGMTGASRSLDSGFPGGPAAAPSTAALWPAPDFERADLLAPDLLAFFMDLLDRERPALAATTARVRAGTLAGAGREAFEAGDQLAAVFLRGIELYAEGQFDEAATQFSAALRVDAQFSPASFYLGACYAAVGRDAEAAAHWQRALAGSDRAPAQYAALADGLSRAGRPDEAIPPLRQAVDLWPEADHLRRRLALAYARTGQHADALATVEPYLERHPADHEALLVALHAIYASRLEGGRDGDHDRIRMAAYARAYAQAGGPHEALVETWMAFVGQ